MFLSSRVVASIIHAPSGAFDYCNARPREKSQEKRRKVNFCVMKKSEGLNIGQSVEEIATKSPAGVGGAKDISFGKIILR
jgi:hypothetical protein